MDRVLEEDGWKQVQKHLPPRGEEITLGESNYGTFSCFLTQITRPLKGKDADYFYYEKDGQKYALRSDMWWKA